MIDFNKEMEKSIDEHQPSYGDSWKTIEIKKLCDRLDAKFFDWYLTKHPKKLISLANLAMLTYIRLKKEETDNNDRK